MSLVQYAETELRRAGMYDADADYGPGAIAEGVMMLIRRFTEEGHSGGSAAVALDIFNRLIQFKPLTPLTNDPAEWQDMREYGGGPVWQSRRQATAFSADGGRTYYDLDESTEHHTDEHGAHDATRGARIMHVSAEAPARA